jgi:hypothetical protein
MENDAINLTKPKKEALSKFYVYTRETYKTGTLEPPYTVGG